MVWLVVRRQRVGLAIEFEPSGSDAVGDPATGRAEVGMLGRVAIERIEAEDDVHRLAILPGHVQARQDRAEVCDGRLPAPWHLERVEVRLATIGQTTERAHGRQRKRSSRHGRGNSRIRGGQRRGRWLGYRSGTRQDHDQNQRRQSHPRHGFNSTGYEWLGSTAFRRLGGDSRLGGRSALGFLAFHADPAIDAPWSATERHQ